MPSRYLKKLGTMFSFGDSLADLGTDPRIKVGALVFPVDCSAVWGIGYNGVAAGLNHEGVTLGKSLGTGSSGAAHAEANALLKAGDRLHSGKPCILYSTLMPCPYCAPLIANVSSVVGVIVRDVDPDVKSGQHVLEAAGIPVLRATVKDGIRDMYVIGSTAEVTAATVEWWRSLRSGRPRMEEGR